LKREKKKYNKKDDNEKNIFPNINMRAVKMMFESCKNFTEKYLKRRGIKFEDFER
jgi:hypothetical protein